MADSLINKLPKAVNGKVPSWLTRALNPSTPNTKGNETVRTTSFEYEGKEILVPTIRMIDGKLTRLSSKDAFEEALKKKDYLIRHLSDEDCFSIVKKYFGWFPEIYSLKWTDNRIGRALKEYGSDLVDNQRNTIAKYHKQGFNNMSNTYRVFKHNNCLPCKNMHQWELFMIRVFYPDYYKNAMDLAERLDSYWGRKDEYTNENSDCTICVI